jgi:hypothetical protein
MAAAEVQGYKGIQLSAEDFSLIKQTNKGQFTAFAAAGKKLYLSNQRRNN